MKRNTQTPEAQRLYAVMVCNPRKARPKKGENPNEDNATLHHGNSLDDIDGSLDDIEIIKEIPAPKSNDLETDAEDDDIFILEIQAPLGAYAINSGSLAHSPKP